MFQKIAKHRANDASNDVHRPPLVFGPLPARIRGRRQPSALHASNTHLWPSNYGKDQAVQKYRNTGMLLQLCSIYLCIKIYQEYRNTWLHNSVQLCIKHSVLLVRPHQEFKPKRKKRMKQKCKKLSLSMQWRKPIQTSRTYAFRGNISEWSQGPRKPHN